VWLLGRPVVCRAAPAVRKIASQFKVDPSTVQKISMALRV
jgi:DNA-binding transcriptional regulator YhcF (GntR family)